MLPTLAAVVPGLLVHGTGHFVAGDRETARRLLIIEGVALGLITAGSAALFATGANRRVSGPAIVVVVGGSAAFFASWFSDIYGSASGGRPAVGPAEPSRFAVEFGHLGVFDPQFDYGHFARTAIRLRTGPWALSGLSWVAVDAKNQRFRASGAYRLFGRGGLRELSHLSHLSVRSSLTYHRFGDDRFSVTTAELAAGGRLDLARIAQSLGGAFFDLEVGLGFEVIDYGVSGAGTDVNELLLMRFGPGFYFGRGGPLSGEVSGYYNHRRDDFAGGISPTAGRGSGFAGYTGLAALLRITERWAVTFDLGLGAALVAETGIRFTCGGNS